ncbi:uncharacterized protein EDB93DRAFT_1253139 [Suillus bovinus]|uniref:uncharacterized protein n=1 Tax=Suillus bovinus TaxID=48563 RepID=UPI001B873673|nr:uncharacterized protein EDB93DRAFT_1253139 [Suillus bovinus]KAG2139212.1 hypothetical protein EDB93DRAFT_1253139 [Suillus bovinus]
MFEVLLGMMTTKEMTQVSAIHTLLVLQLSSSGDKLDEDLDKLKNSLSHKNVVPLKFVCSVLKCIPRKSGRMFKIDYAKALVEWCRGKPFAAPQKEHQFVSPDVLIQEMTVPTWFGSVPSNFGSASARTIKADKWHSLITVYIPIALVSLWGAGTSHPSDEVGTLLRAILDHTMELVCAVYVVCA